MAGTPGAFLKGQNTFGVGFLQEAIQESAAGWGCNFAGVVAGMGDVRPDTARKGEEVGQSRPPFRPTYGAF